MHVDTKQGQAGTKLEWTDSWNQFESILSLYISNGAVDKASLGRSSCYQYNAASAVFANNLDRPARVSIPGSLKPDRASINAMEMVRGICVFLCSVPDKYGAENTG